MLEPTLAPEGLIYHVTFKRDWEGARAIGEYRVSTRGALLEEVGYIHGSFANQVERIGAYVFRDTSDPLVVLVIDPGRLTARVEVENLEGGDEGFPHIYGPLPASAVLEVLPARIEHGHLVIEPSA